MANLDISIRSASFDDICVMERIFKESYKDLDDVPETEFKYFQRELHAAFDPKQVYRICFFIAESPEGEVLSFAGIAPVMFLDGSWELRWGTTLPEYQGRGLMTKLTEHRLSYASKKNAGLTGLVHNAARRPNLYARLGFETIFERGPDNRAFHMIRKVQ